MTIEERLKRLERQSARWRIIASCLGLSMLLMIGLGADSGQKIGRLTGPGIGAPQGGKKGTVQDPTRITLRDDRGRLRIQLHAHPDFGPMISLYDNQNKERMRIGSDQNSDGKPFIWYFDKNFRRIKVQ
jgi:hypothetical protein